MSFSHAHKYAGTPSNELTLWVTKDYQGSYANSDWQQLTINPYTANTSFSFSDVAMDVPVDKVGARTVFAFKYMSTSSNYATWEIKNLNIQATCSETTAIEQLQEKPEEAVKVLRGGHIYLILPNGSVYNIMGQKIQ